MGPQDGVDHALKALAALAERRRDWHAIFMGDGEVLAEMRALAAELGIDDLVEFSGWVEHDYVATVLSSTDVCIAPDPKNALNDLSSMVKISEYMAMGRPIVSFDLAESRVGAGDAALFASPEDFDGFAGADLGSARRPPATPRPRPGRTQAGRGGARLGAPGAGPPRRLRPGALDGTGPRRATRSYAAAFCCPAERPPGIKAAPVATSD